MLSANSLQLTRTLLHYNTVNPPGAEREATRFVGKMLEDAGFACAYHEFADTRTSVIATIGGRQEKPPICFTGHIDVVPLGMAPWSRDPFAGETDGDRVYGRGSTDMKSGIAAFVIAAIELAAQVKDRAGITLVITAGEEIACEGAKYLADQRLLDRAGAIVIAEPTGNYPFVGHKGLCWFEVETKGKTAHGSMPEQGENAILKMNRVISKMECFDWKHHEGCDHHDVMGKPTMNIATLHAGLNTNSVPDSAKLTIDVRTVPGIDHVHLCGSLQSLVGELGSVKKIVDCPALYSEHDEWIESVFEAATPYLGAKPTSRTITFSTDGADLKRGYGGNVSAVILGPGEPHLAHQTDEWCSITRIEQSVDMFRRLMREWNGI